MAAYTKTRLHQRNYQLQHNTFTLTLFLVLLTLSESTESLEVRDEACGDDTGALGDPCGDEVVDDMFIEQIGTVTKLVSCKSA